jgi:diketogulonate reductase-like aldo/keto reductase
LPSLSAVDNARAYGNERSVGAAISHVSSVIPRSELYITTKLDLVNNATDVRAEFEDSIRDLGVDYVDLYLVHFPEVMARGGGYKKVWRAMEKLVEDGKAKSVSCPKLTTALPSGKSSLTCHLCQTYVG